MVHRGQRKLLLMLAAILAPCVVSVGCQVPLGPAAPAVTGSNSYSSYGGNPLPNQYPPGVARPGGPQMPPSNDPSSPLTQVQFQQPDILLTQNGKPGPNGGMPLDPKATIPYGFPPPGPQGMPTGPHGMPMGMPMGPDGGMPPSPPGGPCPNELGMVSHPPYTIAPPDILVIDAMRLIPKPPYKVDPLEILLIQVSGTLPNNPIAGPFVVGPDGTINLGFGYGSLRVAGLTLEQIQLAIRNHLTNQIQNPQVSVALAQFRGVQQTRGDHLVRQDGTINLGTYGCVYVAGLTLGQAKLVVEQHLSKWLLNPEISIDVGAYNSKVYYVIFDGGGYGQQVFRFPITGNETVLSAIALLQGLPPVSSKHRIWVARPAPDCQGCDQVLPVDWNAITQGGSVRTNYQLFPGDRIYVAADTLITIDNWMAKIFAPIERIFGITLLGSYTVQSLQGNINTVGVVGR